MKDSTKSFKKDLETRTLSDSGKKLLQQYKNLREGLSSRDDLSENEKIFRKWFLSFMIQLYSFDDDAIRKYGMGYIIYKSFIENSEYSTPIWEKAILLSKSTKVKEFDFAHIIAKFFIWDFCENFDFHLSKMPFATFDNKAYNKDMWRKDFENYESILGIGNKLIQSVTINMGQKERSKLHDNPQLRNFLSAQLKIAKPIFGALEFISKEIGETNFSKEKIKLLTSEKYPKIRKEIFSGIYDNVELKGNNSKNERKEFLYDLFAIIFNHFPKTEDEYIKFKGQKTEQNFRDYKIEAVRNIVG